MRFKQGTSDPSPEVRQELADYVWYANELRQRNSGTLERRAVPKGSALEKRKNTESATERNNNPGPYTDPTKVAGHMPDTLRGANSEVDGVREVNPMDRY